MTTTRVGYLVNGNLRNKCMGFEPDDLLIYAGDITVYDCSDEDDDLTVCERAFVILNRDDRPFPQTAPSMSTGDVVCLSGGNKKGHRYYTLASDGFERLPEPPVELVPRDGTSCSDLLHEIGDRINAEAAEQYRRQRAAE